MAKLLGDYQYLMKIWTVSRFYDCVNKICRYKSSSLASMAA